MVQAQLQQLIGRTIGDWEIIEILGSGKSAGVFRGTRGLETAAVKVFHPWLVDEFGKSSQLNRIERELSLRGRHHPNLVRIIDGGECKVSGSLYVVMELIQAPNLASVIKTVPRESIRTILSQIASAASFLEQLDIVHRDIKPENIAISSDFSHCTLLDLGVIRPLDVSALAASSNGERQSFLGTLRYSPPEYLFRTEKQSKDGFRAITFYQLGAVLHDLIMREQLFLPFSFPYAKLVKAVEQEIPKIQQPDVPQDLILLARNCLLKNPEYRTKYVKWEDFDQGSVTEGTSAARQRVIRRFALSLESATPASDLRRTTWDLQRTTVSVQQRLTGILKGICSAEMMFPRSTTKELPVLTEPASASVLLIFEAEPNLQIRQPLGVLVTANIIEVEPELVEIDIRATPGYDDSVGGLESLRSMRAVSVFQGVFDDAVVTASLETAMFDAIDSVQNNSKT